ncbi:MAG: hypothetical protein JXR81_02380 [Candidatus Goldbacteria bacterium]|nr:hypothetical protein [Candidatus Goldiibacteriota bacterium]
MKKIFSLLLTVIIFAFAFSSCTKHVSPTATEDPVFAGGDYRMKSYDMYSSGIRQASVIFIYGSGGMTPTAATVTSYDSAGSVSTTSTVSYDSIGNTAASSVYDSDGNLIQRIDPTISGGLLTRADYYDGSNNLIQYVIFQYNAAGQQTRQDMYNASGVLQTSQVTTYNTAGLVTAVDNYTGATLVSNTVNTYDASNQLIRSDLFMMGSLYTYVITQYDAAGNPTIATTYDNTDTVTGTTTITYNSAGSPTAAHTDMSMMGMAMSMDITYTYNSIGMPMEINTTQSMMGMVMLETRNVFTYENF